VEENQEKRAGVFRRGVAETVIAVAALFVSAISLWVGIRTENANEQLVAASTWPFLQEEYSNATPDGKRVLTFSIANGGVGPAKIESFQVFWKGRPYASARELMKACCGFKDFTISNDGAKKPSFLFTGAVWGVVLRAGEVRTFLTYPKTDDNASVWNALNDVKSELDFRICYCSTLDDCWLSSLGSDANVYEQLHPVRVKICPAPTVSFND
jgi:hypothetical protein